MKALLLAVLMLVSAVCLSPCQTYITELAALSILNKDEFVKQVHGFILYSGKTVNDLGLPESCTKFPAYSYFTGQVRGEGEQLQHRAFLGICFSAKCNVSDLEQNSGIIINTLLNISVISNTTSLAFTQPSLKVQSSPGEIVFLILFGLVLLLSFKESVFSFFKNCTKETKKQDEQLYGKYAIQFGDDYDPTLLVVHENQSFLKKQCIAAKMHEYFTTEQSSKIVVFSAIRILAVPLAYYGYEFYLCNIASFNFISFAQQVYTMKYSKLAVSAYYIPDILFFISGFLLAKKAFALIEVEPRAERAIFRIFTKKVIHWVPIYWAVIIIYWQISPYLHAGPVWYEYETEAKNCNGGWWHALLFIDNWFDDGCYNFAWYIPVEIQLCLTGVGMMWVYLKNKKAGIALLIATTLATWILTLTISAPFPTSLDTTLSYNTLRYFKSTYSHMPYYLIGIINGYFAHKEKTREMLRKLTHNKYFRVFGIMLGYFLVVLIVLRPSVWQGELSFELGLAKTGMFMAVYLLMFWNMFGDRSRTTLIHRLATLSKGVLLIGGVVISSFYWGGFTFPYLDESYLLRTTISNLFVGIPVGAVLAALFWERPQKEESIIL